MSAPSRARSNRLNGVLLIGTLISCFIAFYNNYPLVYPDTGSYLHSGWDNVVFYDRTIFYGLFLYEAGFGVSPMLMVFFQGLIICYLIYLTLKMYFEGLFLKVFFLCAIAFLTLFTGFSYNVSILIPDIFSSITLLAFLNLLINRKMRWHETLIVALIYTFSICTQLSTLPVLFLVIGMVFLYLTYCFFKRAKSPLTIRRLVLPILLAASTLFIIPAVHYHYDGYFKISGGNHVFVMNHFVETGVLEEYLAETCEKKSYKICQYKDSIGWDFMWSPNSPLQKTGGWEANRKEYKEIILDILKSSKYRNKLMRKGIEYTFKQFFTFQTTVSPSQMEGSAPYGQVQWRLPDTKREYIASLQSNNQLSLTFVRSAELPVIIGSLLFLLLFLLSPLLREKLSAAERWMAAILLIYCLASAAMCSNLSTIHPRFQNRIVWTLPLCAGIIAARMILLKKEPFNEVSHEIDEKHS